MPISPTATNAACFSPEQITYWRETAAGFSPNTPANMGDALTYKEDPIDKLPVKSGGIFNPQPEDLIQKMPYVRFFGSDKSPEYGKGGAWWVSFGTFLSLQARGGDIVRQVENLLAVPMASQSNRNFIVAKLTKPLAAFTGQGNPAAMMNGSWISEASTKPFERTTSQGTVSAWAPPPGTKAKQIYIPGDYTTIGNAFEIISAHSVNGKNQITPPVPANL